MRAAAPAAAFAALLVLAGGAAYVAARDEPPPATTTTTSTQPTGEQLAAAIAAELSQGLDVPLEPAEARCVAEDLVDELGQDRLEELGTRRATGLREDERDQVVRSVVQCVPPAKAAALLAPESTTTSTAAPPSPAETDL